jgi:hypothetical protein
MFLPNIVRVIERPIAIETISKNALINRDVPTSTWPSIISIIPLISGTPGMRYNTLVPIAISGVFPQLNRRVKEAVVEATKEETINTK